jgi:hypothetical protein
MKPEDIKNAKLEQELNEDELDGATGGADQKIIKGEVTGTLIPQ